MIGDLVLRQAFDEVDHVVLLGLAAAIGVVKQHVPAALDEVEVEGDAWPVVAVDEGEIELQRVDDRLLLGVVLHENLLDVGDAQRMPEGLSRPGLAIAFELALHEVDRDHLVAERRDFRGTNAAIRADFQHGAEALAVEHHRDDAGAAADAEDALLQHVVTVERDDLVAHRRGVVRQWSHGVPLV